MTPVTPVLSRSGLALVAGALAATMAVTLAPGTYYDLIETPFFAAQLGGAELRPTLASLVAQGLMALVVFLVGKEAWEALTHEHAGLSGPRARLPLMLAGGGMAGAALGWTGAAILFNAGDEGAPNPAGWATALGGDAAIAYLFGRRLFGRGHPALQVLLFVAAVQTVAGLVLAGLFAPGGGVLRPLWLLLSAAAATAGWVLLTRPAETPGAPERLRARAMAPGPWLPLAALCWGGVAMSGLPACLGLLPLLPVLPQATRSFGLFALAEGFLGDPANRAARRILPLAAPIMLAFGVTHGAVDAGAAGPETVAALAGLVLGKPLGLIAGLWLGRGLLGLALPAAVTGRDVAAIALLSGASLTTPLLVLPETLAPGTAAEAARLGLSLALLAAPLALVLRAAGRSTPDLTG